MTNQHRATPKQWEYIQNWAISGGANPNILSCLLELRDRIQQLEAAQRTPDRFPLVAGVIKAIAYEHAINPSRKDEARAAIREVASWLRSQDSLVSGNAAAFASLIDAESDR